MEGTKIKRLPVNLAQIDVLSLKYMSNYGYDLATRGDIVRPVLTRKLLNQGFLLVKLKSSLRHYDLVDRYGISVSQMTMDMFH